MNFRRHCVAAVFGLAIGAAPTPSRAFDLEDYATTFRETCNALSQAANQVRWAHAGWVRIREHAALHGWDVRDAGWLMTPGLISASCEAPPGVEFGTNVYGPEMGHAMGDFIREMADVLSPESFEAVLRNYEQAGSWFREQRDLQQRELLVSTVIENPPLPSLPNLCLDQVYYADIEDLQSTIRQYRDAYLKAINQYSLSIAPFKAALAAYRAATDVYTRGTACDPGTYLGATPTP